MIKYISIFQLVLRCLLVARKESSAGFSTGLTGRSKNLDPTGNPTGRSTRPVPVDPSGFHLWPKLQNAGAMPQFCILFYAKYTILATQKGAMAQWPPLNTPLSVDSCKGCQKGTKRKKTKSVSTV